MQTEPIEMTPAQVMQAGQGCLICDIRTDGERTYGAIPGALAMDAEALLAAPPALAAGQVLVICCARGVYSRDVAEELRRAGIPAYSLRGGYPAWVCERMRAEQNDGTETLCARVEHSLRKKYRRTLMTPFIRALKEYRLVNEGDRVAVCMSGGKDSMLMAKLFQELKRYSPVHFEVQYVVMDPGYHPDNRRIIEENARLLEIPVTIFESNIFESVYHVEKSPCYLCARMRRGYLYSFAQKLGCNKIALGHHYDDVIETILMGMLYGGQVQTMMPKLHSTNFPGMELIRPLYLIREDDIKAWRDDNGLHFIQCACRFTDTCTTCNNGQNHSKRQEIKELIRTLKQTNPQVEQLIFRSVENVNLDTVIAYKAGGVRHSFLDGYEEKGSAPKGEAGTEEQKEQREEREEKEQQEKSG